MRKQFRIRLLCGAVACVVAGCGGGDEEPDALPQLSVADSSAVKERKTIYVTATATDDKAIQSFDWQQASGTVLTLANQDKATVTVTAPAVDADSVAELRVTVTDSGGQTAQKIVKININNNKLPTVSVAAITPAEKAQAQLVATAADSDGIVKSYQWTQTAGPAVQLTGATSGSPSFTAPAVTANTALTFRVTVTDDDNDIQSTDTTVTVQQQFASYSVTGAAPTTPFTNANVEVVADGKTFSDKANAAGQFNVAVKTDDDAPAPTFGYVTVRSTTRTGVEYSAFVRQFVKDQVVAAAAQSTTTQFQASQSQASQAVTVTVNEVSTALFALLQQANGGVVPADVASLTFVENQLSADSLMEAAAVAKLAVQGTLALPDGISLVQLLGNTAAYNSYVAALEQADPGVVSRTVAEVAADPALTQPFTPETMDDYYRIYAAGDNFLSKFMNAYHFLWNQTCELNETMQEPIHCNWQIVNGELELTHGNAGADFWVPLDDFRMGNLDAASRTLLQQNNVSQLLVRHKPEKSVLKRLVKGERYDTVRDSFYESFDILPVTVAGQLIDPAPLIQVTSSDVVLRRGQTINEHSYTAAELTGDAFTFPHRFAVQAAVNAPNVYGMPVAVSQELLQTDLLSFTENNQGFGEVSQQPFTWLVDAHGRLQVTFSNGEKLVAQKFDVANKVHSAILTLVDANNVTVAQTLDWVLKKDLASFGDQTNINPAGFYFQNMINGWSATCWQGQQLYLDCNLGFSSFFGWEFLNQQDATEHYNDGAGNRLNKALTWAFGHEGDTIEITRKVCSGVPCTLRVLWPLTFEQRGTTRRIYAIESQITRPNAQSVMNVLFGFRVTAFDELSVNHPDHVAPQQAPRLLLEPSAVLAPAQD